jgi:hypothetical protein
MQQQQIRYRGCREQWFEVEGPRETDHDKQDGGDCNRHIQAAINHRQRGFGWNTHLGLLTVRQSGRTIAAG